MVGRSIRCILFDLGSTLWEREERATLQASELAANAFAQSTLHQFARSQTVFSTSTDAAGGLLRATVERRLRERQRQDREHEPDCALAAMEALRDLGVEHADRHMGAAIYEALRMRIPASRVLCADTLATLAALKERGYLLGIVTNRHYGGGPFQEDLQEMGLLDYIDYSHMAISADLGICKPHPEIFMHTLRSLNVAPQEAAMVGDQLRADIGGAKALHIQAIWKPKASLRQKASLAFTSARAVLLAHELAALNTDTAVQAELELPDEYLLSYVLDREEGLSPAMRITLTPDGIIENLSDLLTLFS